MRLILKLRGFVPRELNAALAVLSAILLILGFPDFEVWRLAFVALVPLLLAVDGEYESPRSSFTVGWIFGTVFFFGSCWWLTFAPITYAGLPWPPVYFLMLCAAIGAGIFPAVFTMMLAILRRRFGWFAIALAPVVWVFSEFFRMWVSGNNWNALGYSVAFSLPPAISAARVGGVYAVSFIIVAINVLVYLIVSGRRTLRLITTRKPMEARNAPLLGSVIVLTGFLVVAAVYLSLDRSQSTKPDTSGDTVIVAVQPNVPMDGLTLEEYRALLNRHVELAEVELAKRPAGDRRPALVVFPESPMMFEYGRDADLRDFLRRFAERNRAAVLINSAEMSDDGKQILNSAVMINESGAKVGQYDKIFLLPFGEYIPFPEPVASWMPAFVGNFKKGTEYDLLPVGEAKAGIMICFESHFGGLSAEYARDGANLLIEMTNDGYLGRTPVLRQHLANAVFRAIETGRPVIRVTNVGITGYIDPDGYVSDSPEPYTEASRSWAVNGRLVSGVSFYSRFGDLFAILLSIATVGLTGAALLGRRSV